MQKLFDCIFDFFLFFVATNENLREHIFMFFAVNKFKHNNNIL